MHLIVDAANVIGSRPDGWWRDRQGAARRLAGRLVAVLSTDPGVLVAALGREPVGPLLVHLVLEGSAGRTPDLPTNPALDIVVAPADGDSAIAALAADLHEEQVVVVTADRALRERVRAHGATAVGPAVLLGALPPTGESPLPAR